METKDRILEAVVSTLFMEGIEAITMKKIAEIAGIGKSTVYEYFSSKEDMLSQSIIYVSNKFIDQFYHTLWAQKDMNFVDTLKISIEKLIIAFDSEIGRFIKMMEDRDGGHNPKQYRMSYKKELIELHEKSLVYTKALIDKGLEEQVLRSDLEELDIVMFQRMLIVYCATLSDETPIVQKYVNELQDKKEYIFQHMMRAFGK